MYSKDHLFARQRGDFEEFVRERHELAIQIKPIFLALDANSILNGPYLELVLCLWKAHEVFMFFPDHEVLSKFEEFGLSSSFRDRFLDVNVLFEQFIKLEQVNFLVFQGNAAQLIEVYMSAKATFAILDCFGRWAVPNERFKLKSKSITARKKEPRNLHREFLKHFKRQRSATKNGQIKYALIDKLLEHEFAKLDAIIGPTKKTPKYVMDCAQGKVEKYYLPKLLYCFHVNSGVDVVSFSQLSRKTHGMSQEVYLNHLFPIFRLILVDFNFLDEKQLMEGSFPYDTYRRYVAITLKRIIFAVPTTLPTKKMKRCE